MMPNFCEVQQEVFDEIGHHLMSDKRIKLQRKRIDFDHEM